MAYRNGSYVAFHAGGVTDPTKSDIKYFNIMKSWKAHPDIEFKFVNSHEKTSAVRDSSSSTRLKLVLSERLRLSKNIVLILTELTQLDNDWVPFEIEYAADKCGLPFIIVYPGFSRILNPSLLAPIWPAALASRIKNGSVNAIHIPFLKSALNDATSQFSHDKKPSGSLAHYSSQAHDQLGAP